MLRQLVAATKFANRLSSHRLGAVSNQSTGGPDTSAIVGRQAQEVITFRHQQLTTSARFHSKSDSDTAVCVE